MHRVGQSGGPVYHYGANRIIGVVTDTYHADKLRNAGLTAKLDFLFSKWKELSKTNDEVANVWEKMLQEQVTDNNESPTDTKNPSAKMTRQKILSDIEAEDSVEVGDVKQAAKSGHSVDQEAATNMKAKNIKIGNLTQEG